MFFPITFLALAKWSIFIIILGGAWSFFCGRVLLFAHAALMAPRKPELKPQLIKEAKHCNRFFAIQIYPDYSDVFKHMLLITMHLR